MCFMRAGVGLYFIWLRYLISFGAVASILHVPALLIGLFGEVSCPVQTIELDKLSL
jgi:hypothetical protein